MKELIILAGANGSGKTTLANSILKENDLFFLNADEIEKTLEQSEKSPLRAGRIFFEKLDKIFTEQKSFILETTLSGNYLENVIKKAKKLNYTIVMYFVFLDSSQLCIERIKTRVENGGHHVPDEDVKRRFYRGKENFWNTYVNKVDRWALYYNANSGMYIEVAKGNSKSYVPLNEDLFNQFIKL
ncbi:MAG TPA: hypothetical protein DCQ31_08125 [Bacteroidales bacterium]|nr:hypothetical protein [Bacteroidales bacterium]